MRELSSNPNSGPTLFVNLFGGPDAGKSTTAAGVFYLLKTEHIVSEYISEYAKDRVWHGDGHTLGQYQKYVHAKQAQRYARLEGKVQVAVSDAPPLLGLVYGRHLEFQEWEDYVYADFLRHWNLNIFLRRPADKPYQTEGRLQSEEDAKKLDDLILRLLASHVSFYNVDADEHAPQTIVRYIRRALRGEDDDSRAAEPHGEVSDEQSENSGSTPTAATKLILPERLDNTGCIWCSKHPCECARLRCQQEQRRPGTDVG